MESFVTSLWRFNVKVDDDDDFEFLSHEMRSKFAIVVVVRPPARARRTSVFVPLFSEIQCVISGGAALCGAERSARVCRLPIR